MSQRLGFGVRVGVAFVMAAGGTAAFAQTVSIGSGAPMVESFSSLATSGISNTTLPTGWYFVENDLAGQYSAGDGSGATLSGGVWSFGTGASSERALGSVRSGSTNPKIGAQLQNATGAQLTEVLVSYTGEQWRIGLSNRTPPDRLDFQFSTDATSLSTGTWVDVDALDFVTPNPSGAVGGFDGNLAINRTAISAVVSGLSIAPNATFWVRWLDPDGAGGADDGLAIDDASFGVTADVPPVVAQTVPVSGATNVPVASNLVVTFSEPVNTDAGAFTLSCPPAMNLPITISGSGSTRTIDPNANLAFAANCTATVVAANVNDLDGTPDDMTTNFSWSFTTVADAVPTIASTTPASGATDIAVNAVVTINFSEPVTTTNPWLTLTCNSVVYSGTIAPSNGGATWTLDPTNNFINGEICTAQITGANVVDQDGVPNAVAGNPSFSFTIAPDIAPSINSTFPANMAVNVPAASNVNIVFSEPVNVQTGAFAINCVSSGAHPFVQTNTAQTQYTLNPNTDFSEGESCTLAITGSLISDLDGVANQLGGDVDIAFTVGAGIAGYYQRVDESSCRALHATLHGVIDDHTTFPYSSSSTDTWDILEAADEDPLNTARVLDVYQNCSYAKGGDRVGGGGTGATCVNTTGTRTGIRFNREHTWPNSRGFNDITDLDGFAYAPYTDTHMLFVSDEVWNADRGSKPYANCTQASGCTARETTSYNGQGGGPVTYPGNHNWVRSGASENLGRFETFNFRKGDTARAQFYMAIRFDGGRNSRNFQREPDLTLTDNPNEIISTASGVFSSVGVMGLLTDLKSWHDNDPVTPREALRNDLIESYQGNRNPFVDHPEWVAVLFGASCTGPDFVAVEDDFYGAEDTVMNRNGANDIGVLNDDRVFAGAALTVNTTPVTLPLHGSVTISNNGQFVYTPAANYCGKDSFVYSVSNGTLTDTAIAHIDLSCTNDLPTTVGSIGNVTANTGSALSITTAQAFNDVDGDDLVFSVSAAPALPLSLDIDAITGVISGTPLVDDAGVYTVVVRATEPAPLTGFVTQTFTLTIVNDTITIFRNSFE